MNRLAAPAALLAAALAALLALGCTGGDDAPPPASTPEATSTVAATAAPSPPPAPTVWVVQNHAAVTPEATATAPPVLAAVEGAPFSAAALAAAVEAAGGRFELLDGEAWCAETSIAGLRYRAAADASSAFGAVFVLWAYPGAEALRADWRAEPGSSPEPLTACEPPSGYTYWHENLVLSLSHYLDGGEEVSLWEHGSPPREEPASGVAIAAFLGLAP